MYLLRAALFVFEAFLALQGRILRPLSISFSRKTPEIILKWLNYFILYSGAKHDFKSYMDREIIANGRKKKKNGTVARMAKDLSKIPPN